MVMVVGVGAQAGEFPMDQSLAEAHIDMRPVNTNPNPRYLTKTLINYNCHDKVNITFNCIISLFFLFSHHILFKELVNK